MTPCSEPALGSIVLLVALWTCVLTAMILTLGLTLRRSLRIKYLQHQFERARVDQQRRVQHLRAIAGGRP